jgi:ABC-type uncharacterized transport system substrate-binding protein
LRYLLLAIAALLLSALPAAAADVLIVESRHGQVYDQTVKQIQMRCGTSSETLVMSDYAEFDLGRIVREEQPRIVVAIGEDAYRQARKQRRTAVIYALTLDVDDKYGDNITGVTMHVAPGKYLQLFKKLQLKRIGILYDPLHSAAWLARAKLAAAGSGVELLPIKVHSPREVPAALKQLEKHSVDGLWMIPDSSAVAAESVDAYFLFAQRLQLPVFSFAKGYLAKGALAVLEGSRDNVAVRSCALIERLRSGEEATGLATVDISEADLFTNESVAARLHLQVSELKTLLHQSLE